MMIMLLCSIACFGLTIGEGQKPAWTNKEFLAGQSVAIKGVDDWRASLSQANEFTVSCHGKSLNLFERRLVTKFSLIPLEEGSLFVVVELDTGGDLRDYCWANIRKKEDGELFVKSSGDIIGPTDKLTIGAVAGYSDQVQVILIESELVVENPRKLVLVFNHRCISPLIRGSLERTYLDEKSQSELMQNFSDRYEQIFESTSEERGAIHSLR